MHPWTRFLIAVPVALVGYVAWFIAVVAGPAALLLCVPVSVGLVVLMLHPRDAVVPQAGAMPSLPGDEPVTDAPAVLRPGAAWPARLVHAGYGVGLVWYTGFEGGIVSPDAFPVPVVAAAAVLMMILHGATALAAHKVMARWSDAA